MTTCTTCGKALTARQSIPVKGVWTPFCLSPATCYEEWEATQPKTRLHGVARKPMPRVSSKAHPNDTRKRREQGQRTPTP